MINFKDETITLEGKTEPIIRWEVWFITPLGLINSITEAKQYVKEYLGEDTNPNIYIIPVAVATGDDKLYEVFRR